MTNKARIKELQGQVEGLNDSLRERQWEDIYLGREIRKQQRQIARQEKWLLEQQIAVDELIHDSKSPRQVETPNDPTATESFRTSAPTVMQALADFIIRASRGNVCSAEIAALTGVAEAFLRYVNNTNV